MAFYEWSEGDKIIKFQKEKIPNSNCKYQNLGFFLSNSNYCFTSFAFVLLLYNGIK